MQSKAATVEQYLAELPADRRGAIQAVRAVFLKNLDKGYQEGMSYGMIGYCVPHSLYPSGYHCDPKLPLPFACLASQKNHMAIYMMCLYGVPGQESWFRDAWAEEVAKGRAKKLDMGKSCIRFKKLEDIPLSVIGEAIRRMPAKKYVAWYESVKEGMGGRARGAKASPASGSGAKGATRPTAKKASPAATVKASKKAPGKATSKATKKLTKKAAGRK